MIRIVQAELQRLLRRRTDRHRGRRQRRSSPSSPPLAVFAAAGRAVRPPAAAARPSPASPPPVVAPRRSPSAPRSSASSCSSRSSPSSPPSSPAGRSGRCCCATRTGCALIVGKLVGALVVAAGAAGAGRGRCRSACRWLLAPSKDIDTAAWFSLGGIGHALGDYVTVLAGVAGWAIFGDDAGRRLPLRAARARRRASPGPGRSRTSSSTRGRPGTACSPARCWRRSSRAARRRSRWPGPSPPPSSTSASPPPPPPSSSPEGMSPHDHCLATNPSPRLAAPLARRPRLVPVVPPGAAALLRPVGVPLRRRRPPPLAAWRPGSPARPCSPSATPAARSTRPSSGSADRCCAARSRRRDVCDRPDRRNLRSGRSASRSGPNPSTTRVLHRSSTPGRTRTLLRIGVAAAAGVLAFFLFTALFGPAGRRPRAP